MSRIGRKRISKWDLKEASQLSSGEIRNNSGPGKAAELDTSMAWDEVINYSTKMSPGLDDWRQRKHNCSPISGSGKSYRSRSRSPRDFRQESGRNDSRIVAQPLKDHSKDHEHLRSLDIPCKFFAAGKCRNGQSCRFSHLGQTRDSPNDMSRNDWRRKSNNTSHVDQVSGGSKWKDMTVPDVSRLPEWNSERSIERIDLNFSAAVPSRQSLDPNGPSSSAFPKPIPGLNAVGQSQQTFTAYAPMEEFITNTQNQQLFQQARSSFSLPDVGDTKRSEAVISEIPSSQNTVSREELSQLTQLSANLARLFETGQLYAALNTSNSMGRVPNPAIGSKKPNDPRSRSIELIKSDSSNHPPGFEPTSVEGCIPDEKPELLPSSVTGGASSGDLYNKKEDPVANCKSEENDRMAAEENKKGQDGGSLEKMDGDGRAEESKNGKGIRAFKFALVEFVKELLKPTWKEGQISKEAHKTIVKKVVDKVTGSIQAVHIPQSQEKIDNYLSSSKPKLSKLVQAYVERYQKS